MDFHFPDYINLLLYYQFINAYLDIVGNIIEFFKIKVSSKCHYNLVTSILRR